MASEVSQGTCFFFFFLLFKKNLIGNKAKGIIKTRHNYPPPSFNYETSILSPQKKSFEKYEKDIYVQLNHLAVQQKLTQNCESTLLQLKKKVT